jgi:hypothetical protein
VASVPGERGDVSGAARTAGGGGTEESMRQARWGASRPPTVR